MVLLRRVIVTLYVHGLTCTACLHPILLEFFVFIKTITFSELLLLSYFSMCIWNIVVINIFAVYPCFIFFAVLSVHVHVLLPQLNAEMTGILCYFKDIYIIFPQLLHILPCLLVDVCPFNLDSLCLLPDVVAVPTFFSPFYSNLCRFPNLPFAGLKFIAIFYDIKNQNSANLLLQPEM